MWQSMLVLLVFVCHAIENLFVRRKKLFDKRHCAVLMSEIAMELNSHHRSEYGKRSARKPARSVWSRGKAQALPIATRGSVKNASLRREASSRLQTVGGTRRPDHDSPGGYSKRSRLPRPCRHEASAGSAHKPSHFPALCAHVRSALPLKIG